MRPSGNSAHPSAGCPGRAVSTQQVLPARQVTSLPRLGGSESNFQPATSSGVSASRRCKVERGVNNVNTRQPRALSTVFWGWWRCAPGSHAQANNATLVGRKHSVATAPPCPPSKVALVPLAPPRVVPPRYTKGAKRLKIEIQ